MDWFLYDNGLRLERVKLVEGWFLIMRSSHWRCSVKEMFLRISQNAQENTCVGVSFSGVFLWIFAKLWLLLYNKTQVFLECKCLYIWISECSWKFFFYVDLYYDQILRTMSMIMHIDILKILLLYFSFYFNFTESSCDVIFRSVKFCWNCNFLSTHKSSS